MKALYSRPVLAITATIFASSLVIAVTTTPARAISIPDSAKNTFCSNIGSNLSKISQSVDTARAKAKTAREDQQKTVADNRAKLSQELAAKRQEWDTKRQENFDALAQKATTDAQKTAVTAYQKTISDAVTKRRAANDAARQTFQTAVSNLIASQKSTADAQATIFASSVSTAITSAQAACLANPTDITNIKNTLQASLKSARETFNNARKADASIGEQVKQLAQTRIETVKANDAEFLATTKAARETLKAAFGTDASSI